MTKPSDQLLRAVKRLRGEENITVAELGRQSGISKVTLYEILNGSRENVRPSTIAKLNEWLYQRV